jgi:hypothetical protein
MIRDGKEESDTQDEIKEGDTPLCTCIQDPFAGLPTELRPTRLRKKSLLRKVTCPECGLVYRTNRAIDLCVDCEKKASNFHTRHEHEHERG